MARNIKYFRDVYMRDSLPKKVKVNESAIVNLDSSSGPGSHWVCYKKHGNKVKYYDSFGNVRPPQELLEYWGNVQVTYNRDQFQTYDTENCGQLCIQFLKTA